jgi:Sulfotransferase domain
VSRHLIIIGAQRCGTTYLHSLLDAHPEIAMACPARPEPKVFLSGELAARGRAWYESTYFAHARPESLLGEKSTSYIESAAAAQRAAAVVPDAIVLVMLRDPVARAVSNWRFSSASGMEERALEQALADNLQGPRRWDPAVTSVSPFAYLERGRYANYLGPWLAAFPDSMHVLFFEQLVGSVSALSDLYVAIGVDATTPALATERVNSSDGTAPALSSQLLTQLDEYFRDSDERLTSLLGRELPWRSAGTPAG